MTFDQGEFDFSAGSEDGYRKWRQRLEEQQRAFETRWGIILGRKVRVSLRWHDHPLDGLIRLASPAGVSDGKALRLRLGAVEFSPAEILSIVRLDD